MNSKISNLRVFAILSVVFGHSIIIYSSTWNLMPSTVSCSLLNAIKQVIDIYQMALYFFISGYLMYYSIQKKKAILSFIEGKMSRLLVPYFLFGLFWMIPIKVMLDIPSYHDVSLLSIITNFILGLSNGHLWFLYTLFILFITLYPLNFKCSKNVNGGGILLMLCALLPVAGVFIPFSHFNIHDVCKYAFWLQLGVVVNQYSTQKSLTYCIIANILYSVVYHTAVVALIIVLMLYYLFPAHSTKWLQDLDSKSFGIYLLHSPFIYITYTYFPNSSPVWVVFLNFVIFGALSYVMSSFIKRTKLI